MNLHKLFFIALFSASASLYCYDPIQEAILTSDYEAFSQQYNAQEVPESLQHAYWAIADDTASMRSTNFAFDWCKAFISKKLIISLLILNYSNGFYNWMYRKNDYHSTRARIIFAHLATNATAWIALFSALADGNTYYHQLQNKIKDAERIKFAIMSN